MKLYSMDIKELRKAYDVTSKALKVYRASKARLGVQYSLLLERLCDIDSEIIKRSRGIR